MLILVIGEETIYSVYKFEYIKFKEDELNH